MSLHFFTLPTLQPAAVQGELNVLLSREKVQALRREFIADGITRTPPHVA